MSRAVKGKRRPKTSRSTRSDGTYVKKSRKPEPREALSSRERMALARDERLFERGLLPQDRVASFQAARPSTFLRPRTDLGGEADAHIRNEPEFWRLRELSRSMDRDDVIPGPVVEAWLDLVVGPGGIQVDPDTGDLALDDAIKTDLELEGQDPKKVDVSGRWTIPMAQRLALRHAAFDGDKLVLFHWDGKHAGKQQLIEGDRLAGCDGPDGDILHGVEVDPETAAVVAYYVLKRRPANRKMTGYRAPALPTSTIEGEDDEAEEAEEAEDDSSPYIRVPAFDDKGRPNAVLILDPKRSTSHRGVNTWHRVFVPLGMDEDTLFATVAGIQGVACIPMGIATDSDKKLGKREEADDDEDGDDDAEAPPREELEPNTLVRLAKGETITGTPKGGPGPDVEAFQKRLYRLVAMQVGLPYSLAFRDTSETVFHGWRGESIQAKRAAEWIHEWYPAQYCRPLYLFRLEFCIERLKARSPELAQKIADAEKRGTLRRNRVHPPAWPYVDPKVDRESDAFAIERVIDSPQSVLGERGIDLPDLLRAFQDAVAMARKGAKARAKTEEEPGAWEAYCPPWARGLALPGAPTPAPAPTTGPAEGGPNAP